MFVGKLKRSVAVLDTELIVPNVVAIGIFVVMLVAVLVVMTLAILVVTEPEEFVRMVKLVIGFAPTWALYEFVNGAEAPGARVIGPRIRVSPG